MAFSFSILVQTALFSNMTQNVDRTQYLRVLRWGVVIVVSVHGKDLGGILSVLLYLDFPAVS